MSDYPVKQCGRNYDHGAHVYDQPRALNAMDWTSVEPDVLVHTDRYRCRGWMIDPHYRITITITPSPGTSGAPRDGQPYRLNMAVSNDVMDLPRLKHARPTTVEEVIDPAPGPLTIENVKDLTAYAAVWDSALEKAALTMAHDYAEAAIKEHCRTHNRVYLDPDQRAERIYLDRSRDHAQERYEAFGALLDRAGAQDTRRILARITDPATPVDERAELMEALYPGMSPEWWNSLFGVVRATEDANRPEEAS